MSGFLGVILIAASGAGPAGLVGLAGLAGLGALRLARRRSLRSSLALVAVVAVIGAMVATAQAMFLSAHDLAVAVVAAVVSGVSRSVLRWRSGGRSWPTAARWRPRPAGSARPMATRHRPAR